MKLLGLGLVTPEGILLHENAKRKSVDDHYIQNAEDLALAMENMIELIPEESLRAGEVVAIYSVDKAVTPPMIGEAWDIITKRKKTHDVESKRTNRI